MISAQSGTFVYSVHMGTPAQTRITDSVEKIRQERGIPLKQLAEQTGIARTTLQRKIADGDEFTVKQLRSISVALDVPLSFWFEVAA